MKKLSLAVLLLAFAPAVFAQTDLDFGEEYEPPRVRALDRLASVFGTKDAARIALKWNALALLPPAVHTAEGPLGWKGMYGGETPFSLSLEGKFLPAFSLVGTMSGSMYRSDQTFPNFVWEQRVEPRFYYEMPRRARAGKQADNLSANYISLEYRRKTQTSLSFEGANPLLEFSQRTFTLRTGLQRRFFEWGWFDLSLGIGRTRRGFQSFYQQQTWSERRTIFDPRLSAGLLFGDFRPKKVGKSARCAVFNCDEDDFSFGKFDLFGLLVPQRGGLRGRLSVAWEMKMGRAPLSLELEAMAPYSVAREEFSPGQFYSDGYLGIGTGAEPRLFLGKKRQNLNGFFVGWNGQIVWLTGQERQVRSTPVVGLQSRLFRNGFVSYKIGVGKSWLHQCTEDFWTGVRCFDLEQRHLLSEFKVGLAF